jgi:hypothetical protein
MNYYNPSMDQSTRLRKSPTLEINSDHGSRDEDGIYFSGHVSDKFIDLENGEEEQKTAIEALESHGSGFPQSEIQKMRAKILRSEEIELEKRAAELAMQKEN